MLLLDRLSCMVKSASESFDNGDDGGSVFRCQGRPQVDEVDYFLREMCQSLCQSQVV